MRHERLERAKKTGRFPALAAALDKDLNQIKRAQRLSKWRQLNGEGQIGHACT